jgi:20S proteasome alpha/beta subunit
MPAGDQHGNENQDCNNDDDDDMCEDGLILLIRSMENKQQQQSQQHTRQRAASISRSSSTSLASSDAPFVSIVHSPDDDVAENKDNPIVMQYDSKPDGFRLRPNKMILMDDMTTRRWTLLCGGGAHDSTATICCMTGFCADVDYLTRVLLQAVDSHLFMHEGSCAASIRTTTTTLESEYAAATSAATTTPLPIAHLVKLLSQELHQAILGNGRPFGVQTLLIGGTAAPSPRFMDNGCRNRGTSAPSWQIWTLDPGGGMRHWGGGATAIGRQAALVRKHLAREMMHSHNNEESMILHAIKKSRSPQAALEMALSSCRNAMMSEEAENDSSNDSSSSSGKSTTTTLTKNSASSGHSYKALLFWWHRSSGRLCIGQIPPEDIQKCQERIRQRNGSRLQPRKQV